MMTEEVAIELHHLIAHGKREEAANELQRQGEEVANKLHLLIGKGQTSPT